MFRVTTVYTNGTTDKLDVTQYETAQSLFDNACRDEAVLFAVWLELGFAGTSDAQWVVVNQGAKYAGQD